MATTHAARETGTRRQHGLTLLELAIVVATAAIVAAAAAPSFTAPIDAATRLAADVQLARSEAIARNRPLRLSLFTGAGATCWIVHRHCVVTPSVDGRWSGRVTLRGDGSTIGEGSERRVCRHLPAPPDAIDANIASAGDDVDVGTALLGRNFLVIGGSERCPGEPRTEPYAP